MGRQLTVKSLQPHTSVRMRVTAANALEAGFISLLLALGIHFSQELLSMSRGVASETGFLRLPLNRQWQVFCGYVFVACSF